MLYLDKLNQLLVEIGPSAGLAGVFETEENSAWELILGEGFRIYLDYDAGDDRLTFTGQITDIGPVPESDLLIRMLQYNGASTVTGGVRLALDEQLNVLQIYDLPVSTLTLDILKNTILDFADKIVAWLGAFDQQKVQTAAPVDLASTDNFFFKI